MNSNSFAADSMSESIAALEKQEDFKENMTADEFDRDMVDHRRELMAASATALQVVRADHIRELQVAQGGHVRELQAVQEGHTRELQGLQAQLRAVNAGHMIKRQAVQAQLQTVQAGHMTEVQRIRAELQVIQAGPRAVPAEPMRMLVAGVTVFSIAVFIYLIFAWFLNQPLRSKKPPFLKCLETLPTLISFRTDQN